MVTVLYNNTAWSDPAMANLFIVCYPSITSACNTEYVESSVLPSNNQQGGETIKKN